MSKSLVLWTLPLTKPCDFTHLVIAKGQWVLISIEGFKVYTLDLVWDQPSSWRCEMKLRKENDCGCIFGPSKALQKDAGLPFYLFFSIFFATINCFSPGTFPGCLS